MVENKITETTINNIINEMEDELNDRDYSYKYSSLDDIVRTCISQKQKLIDLFSKHPHWNPEKMMITFDADMERPICLEELHIFIDWLIRSVGCHHHIFVDYEDQPTEWKICNFMYKCTEQFFNESMQEYIDEMNSLNEKFRLRTNMKTSKAIGKICRDMGWDKLDGYNKRYSALCDCLNPIKIKRHTCISLNPIDFLLMSNGTSWESCHYIGDNSYDAGCYSSGTISYMLDNHSFIFYTVHAEYDGAYIEREPKVNRQVFGYNDEVLAQLRLYPQSNDSGAEDIYKQIREIVQKVVADCLDKPNLWIKKARSENSNIISHGNGATCYPDWRGGNPGAEHCCVSVLKEREDKPMDIVFGAKPICISCGHRHYEENSISCCGTSETCEYCGSTIYDEEDVHLINGYPYCNECVTYCDECNNYELNSCMEYIDGCGICEDCFENLVSEGEILVCDECGDYHFKDNMTETVDGNYYCNSCRRRYLVQCDDCENWVHGYNVYQIKDESGVLYNYCEDCYENNHADKEDESTESDIEPTVEIA